MTEPSKALMELEFGRGVSVVQLRTFEDVWRFANLVLEAGMAPAGMDKPAQICVAVMHGAELGMSPFQSIQRIAVIGGRPTIWGDAALALVESAGLIEDINEWLEGEGDARTAFCKVIRKGRKEKISTFSVFDAKRAGLWDERQTSRRKMKYDGWYAGKQVRAGEWVELPNDSPWFKYPDRMLAMRARGFRLRDSFPDRLGGMYIREEIDDGPVIEHDPTERRQPRMAQEPPAPPPEPPAPPAPPPPPSEPPEPPVEPIGEPPAPPDVNEPSPAPEPARDIMTPDQIARLEGEYVERLRDVRSEDELDILWNDCVAEPSEFMDDLDYQRFVGLDDAARGRLQTGTR